MKRLLFWGLIVPALLRRMVPPWLLESPVALAARHPWITAGALTVVVAAGAIAVAASGVVSVKASGGHWMVTEWFVQFAKSRSIAMHSLGIDVPPLDDHALVLRGARHYDLGCSPCHGTARGNRPRIAEFMLPIPADLTVRVLQRRPEELFSVVKHGLKFTGMPAWPAPTRDDEVWGVVAFLRRLPELDDAEYRRLARGDPAAALWELPEGSIASVDAPSRVVGEICARCHGVDGLGRGAFPKLAGQRAEYMDRALRAYAQQTRHSGIMGPIAESLSADDRNAAVRHYASLAPFGPDDLVTSAASSHGRTIAVDGVASRMIPACVDCHGPSDMPKRAAYPRLAGQDADYLARQLRLLQQRRRGGSEFVGLMHSFVDRLTAGQVNDAAAYFASLGE